MTVIACPKCKDEVRVPARARATATVRCPLCSEEYLLGDALDQLPPELIVVGDIGEEEPVVDAGADYRMAGEPAGVAAAVFDTVGPGSSGAAVARPQMRPRPKRKEKNMVAEMVKVVLGGVVGISLAIPIIWWGPMLWGGKGSDPFTLGPMVSPYAPWIVPTQFHGQQTIRPSLDDTTAKQNAPAKRQELQTFDDPAGGAPNGFDPGGKFASALKGKNEIEETPLDSGANPAPFAPEPILTIDDPLNPAKKPDVDEPLIDDPLAALGNAKTTPKTEPPPSPNLDDLNPSEAPTAPKKKAKKKAKSTPPAEPKTEPVPEPAATSTTPPATAPATTAPVSAEDLSKSLEKATAARAAFDKANADAADAATRRNLATELFAAASAIGPVVSQLSIEDTDNYDQIMALKEFLGGFNTETDLKILGFLADKRLTEFPANAAPADAPPADAGIVVGGTVKDFKAVGSAFETTVELAGGKRTVQIVTPKNLQDQCKIDDRIVVVGRIVPDPKTNLKGYEGEEPLVVTGAYVAVLPGE